LASAGSSGWQVSGLAEAGLDARQMIRYLLSQARGPQGMEVSRHAPEQAVYYRVFSRCLKTGHRPTSLTVLTFVDITPQKKAEAELREALQTRDEFFSIATHELKDPLFSLQLSIQLLRHAAEKQGEIPSHVLHHLEVSQRQAERLDRLIDNLLDVSRIGNGRVRLDLEALDLCELTRNVAGRLQEGARATESRITVENGKPVIGYFDRLKLEQIVSNLLTNALKYGAGRPITVRIQSAGGSAILQVEDHGVGIAAKDQERIFQRFERASQGHKRASLGLGLYIVRSLVGARGGTVQVQSALGKGATFTVTLPRRRLQLPESAKGRRQEPNGGGTHGP
jgi:signal transduction histidine kinase